MSNHRCLPDDGPFDTHYNYSGRQGLASVVAALELTPSVGYSGLQWATVDDSGLGFGGFSGLSGLGWA